MFSAVRLRVENTHNFTILENQMEHDIENCTYARAEEGAGMHGWT